MRHPLATTLMVAALALTAAACQARPEYAVREKKACGYCHVNPNGGGARNARGVYYAMHNHTFVGYDEAKAIDSGGAAAASAQGAKKSGPPAFKSAWTVEVPATAKRVAIADLSGDKKPRLLVLDDHNNLDVLTLDGSRAVLEAQAPLGDKAASFVVGHFAKGKPAVVAAPGAIYVYDGGKFEKKPAPELTDITGSAVFSGGGEAFFFYGGGQPDSYAVDLSKASPLTTGQELTSPAEDPGVYRSITAHGPAELMAGVGVPEPAQKAGVVIIASPRADGKLYRIVPWEGEGGPDVRAYAFEGLGPAGDAKPVWTSEKLAGRVLDIALAPNPKDPAQTGLAVLMATGPDGKGRTVQFFALD